MKISSRIHWIRSYSFWALFFLAAGLIVILLMGNPENTFKKRDYGPLELSKDEIQWLSNNKILYVGIKPGWAPFSFVSEQGEFRGISIDYLNRIEHMLNIKFNRLNVREDITQENADLLLAATPPIVERNPRYRLLNKPYVVSEFSIYTKKANPILDLNGLNGKRVAVFKTGQVAKELGVNYPDVDLYSADIAEEAMNALMKGIVDAYVGNSIVIDYIIQSQGFSEIQASGTTPYKTEVYMAVKQTSPLLASAITKALTKIDKDEHNDILQSWIRRSDSQRNFYFKILVGFILVSFLVIFFFYFINLRLSRLISIRTKELEKEIDERKLIEKNLRETQSVLIESEKMASLGNLVAGIAHEVNTPLGIGITAITHLKDKLHDLLHYFKSDQMKRSDLEEFLQVSEKSVSIIFDNLSRASQLIKSFKEISVDQSGGDVREINLYDYLQQLLISLEPNFKSRLIQVDFLSIAKTIQLKLEPGALAQLLTNLIMNSLVHAFERQQKGLIKITAKTKGKNLLLRYQDNGKGIAAENLHKIFEPFFTTKRLRGGSGLGLHIVYNLVTRKFHGKIQVESELQKGVEFLIELPNCVVKK
jgi:signal transduction histidine kinase